jgi:hypothetical protein
MSQISWMWNLIGFRYHDRVFDQCRMGYNTLKADGEEAMEKNDLDLAEDIGL